MRGNLKKWCVSTIDENPKKLASPRHERELKKEGREIAPFHLVPMRKMRFYHILDAYIEYLRKYDSKIAENKHEGRPYVGVVVQIGEIKYYVPFSSPKPKHLKMKNVYNFMIKYRCCDLVLLEQVYSLF